MSESRYVVCPHCAGVNRVPQQRLGAGGRCGRCKGSLFAAKPVEVDRTVFETHLRRGDLPLLVDFWAPWCGPCRVMGPAFAQAAGKLEPDFRLLKVNTEQHQDLAGGYAIRSIPTLMLFAGGVEVARQAGAMDAAAIVAWAKRHLH